VPPGVFEALHDLYGHRPLEAFASPLNATTVLDTDDDGHRYKRTDIGAYCSKFLSDSDFGGRGDFFGVGPLHKFVGESGVIVVNPPYHPPLVEDMVTRLVDGLCVANVPMAVLVVLQRDSRGVVGGQPLPAEVVWAQAARRLADAGTQGSMLTLHAGEHVFMEGLAHRLSKSFRVAKHATVLSLFQTRAACRMGWPAPEAVLPAVALAMSASSPHVVEDMQQAKRRHRARFSNRRSIS
jgi:hypothetical protein